MPNWVRWIWPGFLGTLIGLVVWRLDAPISLALLLPLIWLNAGSRLAGAGAVMAYYLAGAFDVIDAARMFGQPTFVGVAAWLGQAAFLTIPWLLLWAPADVAGRAWRVMLALVTTAIPPFGLFNWLSPLLAAGELFPGAGLWGLAGAILLSALLSTWAQWRGKLRRRFLAFGLTAVITVQLAAVASPQREPPTGWIGINTTMGNLPPSDNAAQFQRTQAVQQVLKGVSPGMIAILPESIVGRWRPAVQYWLGPGRPDTMVLLGADVPAPEGGYRNALVDQKTGAIIATARIPMPFSLWKPWAPAESAHAAPWDSGLARIAGRQVALSFCYEDSLLWPQLLSLPRHPEVLVSMANNWFVQPDSHASNIQARSISLMAKLFAVPMVRSLNVAMTAVQQFDSAGAHSEYPRKTLPGTGP